MKFDSWNFIQIHLNIFAKMHFFKLFEILRKCPRGFWPDPLPLPNECYRTLYTNWTRWCIIFILLLKTVHWDTRRKPQFLQIFAYNIKLYIWTLNGFHGVSILLYYSKPYIGTPDGNRCFFR